MQTFSLLLLARVFDGLIKKKKKKKFVKIEFQSMNYKI